jgi:hypothetical protein
VLGLGTLDQLVPSQCSEYPPPPEDFAPTAKQLVALGHEIPVNAMLCGSENATADQLVPSQCRIVGLPSPPTAKQLVGEMHATPASAGALIGVRVQFDPFQLCATGDGVVRPLNGVLPTATQLAVVAHATARSSPPCGPGGLGLGTTDHAGLATAGCAVSAGTPAISAADTRQLATRRTRIAASPVNQTVPCRP